MRGSTGEKEGGVGVTPFVITGGEASIGFHSGVQDVTEEFSGGSDEGNITGSKVGD